MGSAESTTEEVGLTEKMIILACNYSTRTLLGINRQVPGWVYVKHVRFSLVSKKRLF